LIACENWNVRAFEILQENFQHKPMEVNIELHFFATLERYTPQRHDSFPVQKGITLNQLFEYLNIPIEEVNLIFIDGNLGNLDSTLKGKEKVSVFPPLGGG